ncbi:MAG: hypothetical protein M1820_009755 [Bogoriella megaspora]|nr:MAG: hypothetical protein M1820_009755 [Bogoriella megaspora]
MPVEYHTSISSGHEPTSFKAVITDDGSFMGQDSQGPTSLNFQGGTTPEIRRSANKALDGRNSTIPDSVRNLRFKDMLGPVPLAVGFMSTVCVITTAIGLRKNPQFLCSCGVVGR